DQSAAGLWDDLLWAHILSKGRRVEKLWVDVERLSRRSYSASGPQLLRALVFGVLILVPVPVMWAYSHQTSRVRFLDYSPEAFQIAQRDGKPVFLLISAVWCYWCKYFAHHPHDEEEVATYVHRTYISIFAYHHRRTDLSR